MALLYPLLRNILICIRTGCKTSLCTSGQNIGSAHSVWEVSDSWIYSRSGRKNTHPSLLTLIHCSHTQHEGAFNEYSLSAWHLKFRLLPTSLVLETELFDVNVGALEFNRLGTCLQNQIFFHSRRGFLGLWLRDRCLKLFVLLFCFEQPREVYGFSQQYSCLTFPFQRVF